MFIARLIKLSFKNQQTVLKKVDIYLEFGFQNASFLGRGGGRRKKRMQ